MSVARLIRSALAATLLTSVAAAQSFDVASVKPSKSDSQPNSNFPLGPGDVYVPNGGLFTATNLPLVTYIFFAYKIIGNQGQYLLPQLPSWVTSERYDIQARAAVPLGAKEPTKDQMRLMMRALLADRFKLAMHNETREVPVLAFVLAKPGKLGPQLKPHPADYPCETNAPTLAGPPPAPLADGLIPLCNGIFGLPSTTPGHQRIGARNVTLAFIADSLSGGANLGRPMVDKTGLTGTYDFLLEWTPDRGPSPAAGTDTPVDPAATSLQQALQDQLGIRLQSDKAPMNVYVIDHLEHAIEN